MKSFVEAYFILFANFNISFFTFLLLAQSKAEVFSALNSVVSALNAESTIGHQLKKFVITEREKLNYLDNIADDYIKLSTVALKDPEAYVSNPIAAFLTVQRMTSQWKKHIEPRIIGPDPHSQPTVERIYAARKQVNVSASEDLEGAIDALLRLQYVYKLKPENIANGRFLNYNSHLRLDAADCFAFARRAYNMDDFVNTLQWSQVVLDMDKEKRNGKRVNRIKVLDYISFAAYKCGDIIAAKRYAKESLKLQPDQPRIKSNVEFYEKQINKDLREKQLSLAAMNMLSDWGAASNIRNNEEERDYGGICRATRLVKPTSEHELLCRFVHNDDPRLILMPVKEESLLDSPSIVLYHNILSDYEIDVIKEIATPRLRRAVVWNRRIVKTRISKSAWIKHGENRTVDKISYRLSALLRLSLETAENLQVANYGIGGHYNVHPDFARNDTAFGAKGNRIATLSDVKAGGATAFPLVGIRTTPKKGTAVFWFNLFRNGHGDGKTLHGACPVLIGSKWVAVKWFHARGQEFLQPCSRYEYDRFGINDYFEV